MRFKKRSIGDSQQCIILKIRKSQIISELNRYNCGSLIKPIPVVPYIKPRPPSNVVVPYMYIKPRPPSNVVVPYIKPRPPSNVVVPYIKPRPPSNVVVPYMYIKPRPPSNVVVPYIKPRPPSVKTKPRKRKRRRSTKSPKIWIRIIREKTVEKKRKK
jgi:hypothetical protein